MNGDDVFVAPVREVYAWDHERLWRSIYAFSGSRDVADEAVDEAFTRTVRGAHAIRDVTASVWRTAFTIVRGEVAQRPTEPAFTGHASGIESRGDDELSASLSQLDGLADDDRRLLAWRHVGGWNAKEMAPALGMRATTVRLKLLRADRRLEALLGDDPGSVFEPFDRVPVPDRWADIVARATGDDISTDTQPRRRRPLVAIAGLTAVVALVGALVVVVTGSPTPVADDRAGDERPGTTGLAVATIGDGREVTLAINEVATGEVTGTFRLRLYEAGGATLLEYEDVDVVAGDDVEFQVVEVDGREQSRATYTPGSIGASPLGEATVTDPFRVRIVLTDSSDEIVHSSDTILLTPNL
ncbi:MAG TPA: hypothetical protein VK860_01160 [Ilumatobacteraceae bacterium]|nr:hypothetical protein [Ilumatobacteraceae bacterium]